MELFLNSLLSFLLLYKYTALFTVSFLAAVLLPLPSSSLLAGAGAFASQGYFGLFPVLVVAFIGNVAGDLCGYLISRKYGKEVLIKIGFAHILSSKRFIELEKYTRHFSYSLILISRFLSGVGPAVNILSGLTKISYRRFIILDLIGEAGYVLLYGVTGYYLGNQWQNNIGFLVQFVIILLLFFLSISLIQYKLFSRRNTK